MSWFIKTAGTPADVKALAASSTSIPDSVKRTIAEVCDGVANEKNNTTNNGVYVEGMGHYGEGDWWNAAKLTCEPIQLALPTPPAQPAETPPAAA